MGWIKWAYILSIYYLFMRETVSDDKLSTFYQDAMGEIMALGGDTDTNCCIAGGVIGAMIGLSNIP
jgi:ADP-ribosylglycohydrolase